LPSIGSQIRRSKSWNQSQSEQRSLAILRQTSKFRLYNPRRRAIITSTRPRFSENKHLKWRWGVKTPADELESDSNSDTKSEEGRARDSADEDSDDPNEHRSRSTDNGADSEDEDKDLIEREPELEALGQGLRVYKAKRFFDELGENAHAASADEVIVLPKDYSSTIDHPEYSRQWRDAVADELEKLFSLGTFEYTELPPGKETVDTKWVFTVKYTPTGLIDRFKARLVARGFS